MNKLLLALIICLIAVSFSCKKKTCPAYMSPKELEEKNNKEMKKDMRRRKHKKAKLY